jgi:hypothetical protein
MAVTPTTWNPADKDSAGGTLSGGNLTYDSGSGSIRSVYGATTGKFYWEITYPVSVSNQMAGVATIDAWVDLYPGQDVYGWGIDSTSGVIYNGTSPVASSTEPAPVTTLGVLLDVDAKELRFQSDGVDCGVVITLSGTQFYAIVGATGKTTANFGATAFNHAPPVGYEAGFGVPDPNRTVYPEGRSVFAFGTPAATYGPNRAAQVIGAGLLSSGTATAIQAVDVTVYPQGNSIAAFGTPSVIRGPNRTAQAVGGIAFSSGVHHAQLGYPASVVPEGVSVFSAGTPEALPYAAKTLPVPGASVFGAGRPMAIADPIATAYTTVVAVGASVFSAGTPTSTSAATVQAAGASVFKSGAATASPVANAVGVSVFRAGTPVAAQTARPVGVSVFGAGTPSVTMLAFPLGASVFHAGTPKASAAGSVTASGASTFGAGTPRTSACVHARGSSLFRSGRPSIDRGATC